MKAVVRVLFICEHRLAAANENGRQKNTAAFGSRASAQLFLLRSRGVLDVDHALA